MAKFLQQMRAFVAVSFLLLLCCQGHDFDFMVDGAFRFQSSNDTFNVFLMQGLQGIKIITHSAQQPFILAGAGHSTFKEHEGNFDIKHYTDFKIPLWEFHVLHTTDVGITVAFTDGREASQVEVCFKKGRQQLEVAVSQFSPLFDRAWFRLHEESGEQLFGGGEQYSYFNLNGRNFPIWTREQGVGRNKSKALTFMADAVIGGYGGDYHTTYFPQATFTSTRKFFCHFEGYNYMEMNFTPEGYHEIFSLGLPRGFFCQSGKTYQQLLYSLTDYFGRQPVLPDWLRNGIILGLQGGTQVMKQHLQTVQDHRVPVAGIWIQDWPGNVYTSFGKRVFWNWQWNPKHYPDLDKEILFLRDTKGIRLLAYITPHLNTKGALFTEAKRLDLLMKTGTGEEYIMNFGEFECGTVDLTNPRACQWYKGVIKTNLIDFGFGGWMADFSEYIPVDAVFYSGQSGMDIHNEFPVLWAKLNREAVEESGKLGEIMFFMRAGGAGSQRYTTMTWAGDQTVDFNTDDGFPSVIPAALSLGMCGVGLTHFDIGGYTTIVRNVSVDSASIQVKLVRSRELFLRMAEIAVFTPVMRTHEGNIPHVNFQIYNDSSALKHLARLVSIYQRLSPYTVSLLEEHAMTGLPLQRPVFLHYPQDSLSYTLPYQFMYGRDLLVAPVLQPGVHTARVYLPADAWVELFTGVGHSGGGYVDVESPLGKPPVFYRGRSEWSKLFESLEGGLGKDRVEL